MKIVKIERYNYVANDGTVFDNKIDCANYEENVKKENNEIFYNIESFDLGSIINGEDRTLGYCKWYKLKNSVDLDVFKAYLQMEEFLEDGIIDFEEYKIINKYETTIVNEIIKDGYSIVTIGITKPELAEFYDGSTDSIANLNIIPASVIHKNMLNIMNFVMNGFN